MLGKDRKVLERVKRKLMGRFSMADMGAGSMVLGMAVTVTTQRRRLPLPRKSTPSPCWSGTGWELQSRVHARCGRGAFIVPGGGNVFKQRRRATVPGYHGQSNIPRTGESQRHRVQRQPTGAGDAQTF